MAHSIPNDIQLRLSSSSEGADGVEGGDEIYLTMPILRAGFRLHVPLVVREILDILHLAPSQVTPNGWRILIGMSAIWPELFKDEGRPQLIAAKLLYLYTSSPANQDVDDVWKIHSRGTSQVVDIPHRVLGIKRWQEQFFFVSRGFEFFPQEDQIFPFKDSMGRVAAFGFEETNLLPFCLASSEKGFRLGQECCHD